MFCPSCGIQLSETTPFCTQCGSPVKASAQVPAQVASVAPASVPIAKPGNRKIGMTLLLVGVIAALGVGAFIKFGGGSSLAFSNSAVETVRGGVLKDYNTTTVGKAFEGTFQNAKWSSLETAKGETVVQFDGTVQSGLLRKNVFIGKMTADELTNASRLYANDPIRNHCIASLGLADRLAELKGRAAESEKAYLAAARSITRQVEVALFVQRNRINYRSGNSHTSPYDNQPFVNYPPAGIDRYPFRDLDSARRSELDAEKDALAAVNNKIAECMNNVPVPVKFQFTLSADKKTFKVTYVDDAFGNKVKAALTFIYQ